MENRALMVFIRIGTWGYYSNVFTQLLEFERCRRPLRSGYGEMLKKLGFQIVDVVTLDEVRKVYTSFVELESEILERKGKSILF